MYIFSIKDQRASVERGGKKDGLSAEPPTGRSLSNYDYPPISVSRHDSMDGLPLNGLRDIAHGTCFYITDFTVFYEIYWGCCAGVTHERARHHWLKIAIDWTQGHNSEGRGLQRM